MAVSIPSNGITLQAAHDSLGTSSSAITLRLGDGIVQDIKKASQGRDGLQFVCGSTPKLRIGGRTIDLSLSSESFRNELYASTVAGSLSNLHFAGVVNHRAVVRSNQSNHGGSEAGADAALAALQSSLASLEQEKQANQADIRNDLLPLPKNRFDAARKHKRMISGGVGHSSSSPSSHATQAGAPGPTSAYTSEGEVRMKAMRTPIIHLLAIEPATIETIATKTHIRRTDLHNILQKIAEQRDGKWQLVNRAYRDLDVWNFRYTSEDARQSAIDNAVRAYDRLRVDKGEKIWQKLLPEQDRDKGIILSRLHLNGGQLQRGSTPHRGLSPAPHSDAGDSRPASAANTPRAGASPRPSSSKGDMMKRLLSKDPKKARAVEEAKEKKRKEKDAAREAAASDRETSKVKKQPAKKANNTKIKSAEIVHSSDDESGEEGEVKEGIHRVDSKVSPDKPRPTAAKPNPKPTSTSPDSSDSSNELKKAADATKKRDAVDPARSIAALASKAAKSVPPGKATPRSTNGLSAPSSQHKSQRSPQKSDSRPNVPSPLGAARPRVASDVSDRNALGVQRTKQPGAQTPQGLGITNGARKRQDTITSTASTSSSASDKKRTDGTSTQKALTNGTGTPKLNGVVRPAENGVKRKAEGTPSEQHPTKHRKTESTSSQSQNSVTGSSMAAQSTARTSPDRSYDGGSSDSAASVLDTITFTQGVSLAEKFSKVYYPAYTAMYDAQAAKEAKGETVTKDERDRLWAMHRRLEQLKREIQIASQREHRED